jgi:hypothetical protein
MEPFDEAAIDVRAIDGRLWFCRMADSNRPLLPPPRSAVPQPGYGSGNQTIHLVPSRARSG